MLNCSECFKCHCMYDILAVWVEFFYMSVCLMWFSHWHWNTRFNSVNVLLLYIILTVSTLCRSVVTSWSLFQATTPSSQKEKKRVKFCWCCCAKLSYCLHAQKDFIVHFTKMQDINLDVTFWACIQVCFEWESGWVWYLSDCLAHSLILSIPRIWGRHCQEEIGFYVSFVLWNCCCTILYQNSNNNKHIVWQWWCLVRPNMVLSLDERKKYGEEELGAYLRSR